MKRRDPLALAGIACLTAAYMLAVVLPRAKSGSFHPSYDTYGLFYPDMLYAADALRRGEGLLWNRFQNCGQPFFAIAGTGILYPPHALYFLLDPHTALLGLFSFHLLLAGIFSYVYLRNLGLGTSAALAGSFAFELGGVTLFLAYWHPTLIAHYVWIPAAMTACERVLRRGSGSAALALGIVLSVQFLAGSPQMTLFTYQLIALRLLWEVLTGDRASLGRKLLLVAMGLALPAGITAVQLLPSAELAAESLRAGALTPAEIRPAGLQLTWAGFRKSLNGGTGYGSVLSLVPIALAAVGLTARRTRSQTAFYLLVGALSLALVFDNPLFALYRTLPFGVSFRMPQRFLWVTGFAASVLTALGIDALQRDAAGVRRWLAPAAALAGVGALVLLSATGRGAFPWTLAGLTIGACLLAAFTTRGKPVAALALPALVLASLAGVAGGSVLGFLPNDRSLFEFRPALEELRPRLTAQDRIFQYSSPRHFGLQRKSASILRVPSITDYETQTSQRYAELYVRMVQDRPMRSINEFYYQVGEIPKNRPLLDLLAARYVVLHVKTFFWPEAMRDLQVRQRSSGVAVFENPQALPRAYFVPRIEVVADPAELLERLASTAQDPRRAALVETPPPGDLGNDAATGSAAISEDRGEEVRVRVSASAPGFLVVTDQLYPGWEATVDGKPQSITRANYAFRLVRVPAGESNVVFRYRPRSLRLGLALSSLTLVILVAYGAAPLVWRRRVAHAFSSEDRSARPEGEQ